VVCGDLGYPLAVFGSRPSRARLTTGTPSPLAAAVLSLLFPGLGQLYAGRPRRALAWVALPILVVALLAGLLVNRDSRQALLAAIFAPDALQALLVLDIAVLAYRAAAIIDAHRLASRAGGPLDADAPRSRGPGSTPRRRAPLRPVSIAGLLGVLLVLGIGHAAVARYDRIAFDTIAAITGPSAVGDAGSPSPTTGLAVAPSASGGASPATGVGQTASAAPSSVPWNGTGRLNVLLLGSDQRPPDPTFNTDTMIVASIDPASGEVAMFSVPRDTENVPLAAGTPAAAYFPDGLYPNRLNSLWTYAYGNPGLFPGPPLTRGFTALKGAVGQLLGIDIPYYVMVNFSGFRTVVDTLGGAMIDVQLPVADYDFPATDTVGIKLYIPPGIQYMTGSQALAYARARHETNDFDRSQRQQRVITSIREQLDVLSLLNPNRLDALSSALSSAIHTDYPAANLPALISLIEKVDLAHLRSYVFTPPTYETQCSPAECAIHYYLHPNVAVIQAAVRTAFTIDPALERSRQALAGEGATVWVLNGSTNPIAADTVTSYLEYLGVSAIVPPVAGGRASRSTYPDTVVTFYNGAERRLPETVRVLERTFGVAIATATDPTVTADVIVIVGRRTPTLQVPGG